MGFEYTSHFNPIPDPAIAFVLTAVRTTLSRGKHSRLTHLITVF